MTQEEVEHLAITPLLRQRFRRPDIAGSVIGEMTERALDSQRIHALLQEHAESRVVNQVCQRYFALHDLEFTAPAIEAVKAFPGGIGAPRYIIVLRLAPEGQELPEEFRPNDNVYGTLE